MLIENIKKKAEVLQLIRTFFCKRDYLEIETPLLSTTLIPEPTISMFQTEHTHPFKKNKVSYLTPSPEVWLKRFLSEQPYNIFEISKCFRNSEQSGRHHNPEFTMLEYYTMDFTYQNTLELTIKLLDYINSELPYSKLPKKHLIITMDEIFNLYAGFSLEESYTIEKLHCKAIEFGISVDETDDWETAFNRVFLNIIEPKLPKKVNLFITDFPNKITTLSKNIKDTPWAQRWELYINGIECGNCYTEETNQKLIKKIYIEEKVNYEVDVDYPSIFKNFPECSGGAIGIDRLLMEILGVDNIQEVILFPYSHGSSTVIVN